MLSGLKFDWVNFERVPLDHYTRIQVKFEYSRFGSTKCLFKTKKILLTSFQNKLKRSFLLKLSKTIFLKCRKVKNNAKIVYILISPTKHLNK